MNIPVLTDIDRKLITDNVQLVFGVWKNLANNWIKFSYKDDLIEVGYEGLCKAAVQWHNINAEGKFSTFAYPYIRSAIYNELRIIRKNSTRECSIDEPVYKDGNEYLNLGDCITNPNEENLDSIENLSRITLQSILPNILNASEYAIIKDYAAGYTYTQIGMRRGISRQRIGQYMNQIRIKLRPIYSKYFKE